MRERAAELAQKRGHGVGWLYDWLRHKNGFNELVGYPVGDFAKGA